MSLDDLQHHVWLLGCHYPTTEATPADVEHIGKDIANIVWATYRSGMPVFDAASGRQADSDAGWGCMIRSGQMVLAQALQRHNSNFEFFDANPAAARDKIVQLILDHRKAAFSIHNIVDLGSRLDKPHGVWYGPNTVAQVLRELVRRQPHQEHSMRLLVASDGVIYGDQVRALSRPALAQEALHRHTHPKNTQALPVRRMSLTADTSTTTATTTTTTAAAATTTAVPATPAVSTPRAAPSAPDEGSITAPPAAAAAEAVVPTVDDSDSSVWQHGVMILVPLRLGLGKTIEPDLLPALLALFKIPLSIGCIGGTPRRSLYFVGASGGKLVYLDPHVVHPAAPESCLAHLTDTIRDTYSCSKPGVMEARRIDPSLAVAFYCSSAADLKLLQIKLEAMKTSKLPLILDYADSTPAYLTDCMMDMDALSAAGSEGRASFSANPSSSFDVLPSADATMLASVSQGQPECTATTNTATSVGSAAAATPAAPAAAPAVAVAATGAGAGAGASAACTAAAPAPGHAAIPRDASDIDLYVDALVEEDTMEDDYVLL